jgi:release factor glutamine methyltransferase
VAETWTSLKVLTWTAARFSERGLASPRLDAEVLLAHVLGTTRVQLYTGFDKPLGDDELARYRELIKRRLGGEPVAYLVGEQEFWSMALHVDAHVLIPRPDSETLVEVGLRHARARPPGLKIADVCTGSGAVALALAKELPDAEVWASDVSPGALAVARRNAARHGLERVHLVEGDLLAPLRAAAPFDLIVANPPYLPAGDLATLAPEVQREPHLALVAGPTGLELADPLITGARDLLAPGGRLALEHGFDQGPVLRERFTRAGYAEVATTRDLAGHERVTSGLKS